METYQQECEDTFDCDADLLLEAPGTLHAECVDGRCVMAGIFEVRLFDDSSGGFEDNPYYYEEEVRARRRRVSDEVFAPGYELRMLTDLMDSGENAGFVAEFDFVRECPIGIGGGCASAGGTCVRSGSRAGSPSPYGSRLAGWRALSAPL